MAGFLPDALFADLRPPFLAAFFAPLRTVFRAGFRDVFLADFLAEERRADFPAPFLADFRVDFLEDFRADFFEDFLLLLLADFLALPFLAAFLRGLAVRVRLAGSSASSYDAGDEEGVFSIGSGSIHPEPDQPISI